MPRFLHLVVLSPTFAFILLVVGVLAIYRELLNPGRYIPGLVGLTLVVISAYGFVQNSPTVIGLALIGAAIALFVAESLWNLYFLPGVVATLLLIDGFRRLIPGTRAIHLPFAVVGSCVLGTVTVLMAYAARRARQNKWSDLPPAPKSGNL